MEGNKAIIKGEKAMIRRLTTYNGVAAAVERQRYRRLTYCLILSIFTIFTLTSIVKPVYAEPRYSSLWISAGTESGFSLGVRGESVGLEFGGKQTSEYLDSELLDYPVPHSDYSGLGRKRIGNMLGLDLLGFYNFSSWLSLYAGIGGYVQEIREVARSNVTGWLYTQSRGEDGEFAVSGGLQAFPSEKLLLGIGFHNVRGVIGQVGIRF